MARTELPMEAAPTGRNSRLQRQPWMIYTRTSAAAATATQRQFSSRISSQSSDQLRPCRAQAKQARETTMVTAPKIRERVLLSGAGPIPAKNHTTSFFRSFVLSFAEPKNE